MSGEPERGGPFSSRMSVMAPPLMFARNSPDESVPRRSSGSVESYSPPPQACDEHRNEEVTGLPAVSSGMPASLFSKIDVGPPPGRALLEEVLSQHTNFAPQTSVKSARIGRGLAGAPSSCAWSAAHVVEQRYGRRARRYQMQTMDRGPENITRPGTAPPPYLSPGSPMFNSSPRSQSVTPGLGSASSSRVSPTQESPARDRLPRTAQQFPAIVSACVTSSSMMKPPNQDAILNPMDLLSSKDGNLTLMTAQDEDRPPFRFSNHPHLIERRIGPVEDESKLPQGRASEPDSRLLHRKSAQGAEEKRSIAKRGSNTRRVVKTVSMNEKDIFSEKSMPSSIRERRATGANLGPLPFAHDERKKEKKGSLASYLAAATAPGTARPQRQSKFDPLAALSANVTKESEEENERHKKGIWKLALHSSKDDRLERLNIHRKIKESELLLGDRDKVVTREEVELAEDSFYRYYRKSTFHQYNQELVLSALADFGIRAHTRPEKLGLLKVLEEYEEQVKEFTFKDFCSVVEEARVKMRSVRFSPIFLAWRNIDLDDIGALSHEQIYAFLELLNAVPTDQGELAMVDTWIEDLHKDSFGLIALGEVEYLMQQCREHQEATRRRAERHIQEQFHLAGKTFQEFRSQLIDLHNAFTELSQEGPLGTDEVAQMLSEFGITPLSTSISKHRLQEHIRTFMTQMGDGNKLAFPWLLMLIRSIRKTVMEDKTEDVRMLFNLYDKDRSEALDMKEICMILVDLNLQPRSPSEQDGIAELLEEVDTDGTGTLDFDELLNIVVRISERIAQLQRHAEDRRAEVLGFSRQESMELRRAFEALDTDDSGFLCIAEIYRAVQWMQWRVSDSKLHSLMEDIDEDRSGSIEFSEFLELMRRIDDDVKAAGDDRPVVEQKKDSEAASPEASEKFPDKAFLRRRRGKAAVASIAGIAAFTKTRGTVISNSGK